MQNIGTLNESHEHFLGYILPDFAREVLSKNKMKIYSGTGKIYCNNLNMRETIYSFMYAQQDETKKIIDFGLDINNDFELHLNELFADVTDDRFDINKQSTSKKFFYRFDNARHNLDEEPYKIRHTIVSDNQHALENLQRKDWSYFINHLLEVSNGDISSLILVGISQNQNNMEELKIINDTVENLEKCKNYYADVYANVSGYI